MLKKFIKDRLRFSNVGYRHGDGYYHGRAILVAPIELRKGLGVITPDGYGFVSSFWNGSAMVEVKLERQYTKSFPKHTLKQYVVKHGLFNQLILVSAHCYKYLYEDGQPIEYRITTRKRAMLSDKSMSDYEHIEIFSKYRYGRGILSSLIKRGYKITKDESKSRRSPRRYNFFGRFEIETVRKKSRRGQPKGHRRLE